MSISEIEQFAGASSLGANALSVVGGQGVGLVGDDRDAGEVELVAKKEREGVEDLFRLAGGLDRLRKLEQAIDGGGPGGDGIDGRGVALIGDAQTTVEGCRNEAGRDAADRAQHAGERRNVNGCRRNQANHRRRDGSGDQRPALHCSTGDSWLARIMCPHPSSKSAKTEQTALHIGPNASKLANPNTVESLRTHAYIAGMTQGQSPNSAAATSHADQELAILTEIGAFFPRLSSCATRSEK